MPTYIVLNNWTEQGIRNVKDTVNRLNAARRAAEAAGVRILAFYWTLGQYDLVAIIEAPDDEAMARLGLQIGMQGNARTITLRAFSEQEMQRVLQGLG